MRVVKGAMIRNANDWKSVCLSENTVMGEAIVSSSDYNDSNLTRLWHLHMVHRRVNRVKEIEFAIW